MKCNTTVRFACLTLLSILALSVNAEGLSEYLQSADTTKLAFNSLTQTASDSTISSETKDTAQLKNIIELVVAGIVAAALIIVVLVIFLGRWLAGREKKLIKELRIEAEENTEHITTTANSIREQEQETSQITETMRNQANELSIHKKESEISAKNIIETSRKVKKHEKEINQLTDHVSENMGKIQKYWDQQVSETVDTISLFQHNLNQNIDVASEGLEKLNEQKIVSSDLLQDFLSKHKEQNSLIDNNSELSEKVAANLNQAYSESNKLIELLKKQQEHAESSLNDYSERLNTFEEQAYEQFDTSFQVADLARQELSANLDENRKHIETMRRQEEQSHGLNNQIVKNLETLDYSKIVKISETLDTTQDMFDEIHHKVEETRTMLDDLKQIEEEIKQTASNVESVAKSHSILDQHEVAIDQQIDDLIGSAEEALNIEAEALTDITTLKNISGDETSTTEKELSKGIADALNDVSSTSIKGNTTVAISDYKMANGDSSTPLSFFRDIKKNK